MADDVIRDVPPAGMRLTDRFNLEKVSWGAIWAGTVVTIGMEALFLSFGIFIGGVFGGSAIWTLAWYLVTMGVSFYTGAWAASRLADVSSRDVCILHGLSTWGLATLATVLIAFVVAWATLRVGTTIVVSGATAATAPPAPSAHTIWGNIEEYGGIIWGGIMLSLITSYFGGATGKPSEQTSAQMPQTSMRRA